jgi:dihydroorotase
LGKIIVAHCEDNSLLNGGYIRDGEYAKLHGHKGICSESEWGPIKRDLELAKETGCAYHVCHISCKESVELIRQAKKDGVDITCETAPHYLVFNDMDLQDEGRFKMNPPIRSEEDRLALIEGICDGTIDMIATDHAPHSEEEKTRGLKNSFMGVVGIETAFSVMYTYLVKKGVITLEKLIELMSINPRKRFGLEPTDDICVFDLESEFTVDPKDFLSMGKFTPFEGHKLNGVNKLTVCNGKIVYKNV